MKGVDQDTSLTTRSERWQFLLLDGDSLYVAFEPLHLITTLVGLAIRKPVAVRTFQCQPGYVFSTLIEFVGSNLLLYVDDWTSLRTSLPTMFLCETPGP